MSQKQEMTKLVREYRQKGWIVEKTKSSHWRFVAPTGEFVITGTTPSGFRSMANAKAKLKRAERRDQTATKSL